MGEDTGVDRLSRRSIARIIAAISAALLALMRVQYRNMYAALAAMQK